MTVGCFVGASRINDPPSVGELFWRPQGSPTVTRFGITGGGRLSGSRHFPGPAAVASELAVGSSVHPVQGVARDGGLEKLITSEWI